MRPSPPRAAARRRTCMPLESCCAGWCSMGRCRSLGVGACSLPRPRSRPSARQPHGSRFPPQGGDIHAGAGRARHHHGTRDSRSGHRRYRGASRSGSHPAATTAAGTTRSSRGTSGTPAAERHGCQFPGLAVLAAATSSESWRRLSTTPTTAGSQIPPPRRALPSRWSMPLRLLLRHFHPGALRDTEPGRRGILAR